MLRRGAAILRGPLRGRRSLRTMDFGGTMEPVHEARDFPAARIQGLLGSDRIAVLGYGTQGRAQSQNLRDRGLDVIVGQRPGGRSWELAVEDGWVPGKTLLPWEEAAEKGTLVMNMFSDGGQMATWPVLRPLLAPGKTLCFAHGFSLVFSKDTGVVPPKDIDVVLVAPKGSGTTLRRLFLANQFITSSIGVWQDVSGQAQERALALGVAIGSGYMYETTCERETVSDLFGERGVLVGAMQGLFQAQYQVLRENGYSPSEAFNETVEEATQSLIPLIGENGMDWMYNNCSTTARRGALDWWKPFRDASLPVFRDLYREVDNGNEARRTLAENSRPDYQERLDADLREITESELWRAGQTVRRLRPGRDI